LVSSASCIRTRCLSAVIIADLRSYALQNLVATHFYPTFLFSPCLLPLPLATFIRAARLPSTSPTSVRTHCRTSLVRTMSDICMSSASAAITAGYIRMRCSPAVNITDLRSYVLQNSGMHRCQTFVYPPRLPPLPLSYIRTHCSSAVNIADLRSYALQNLVGMHRSQTLLYPPRLPLFPLATFVRAARLPSTSPNSVRTHCRTTFVCAAVLHSYALLLCHLHR